jgi:hypothetical protein
VRWKRLGLVFSAADLPLWAATSALQPTPWRTGDGRLRVFAGFRDSDGRSRVGFVDLDEDDPRRVQQVSAVPALDLGEAGAFDQDGVVPCAVIADGAALRLYYAGYRRGDNAVRFTVFGGAAVSDDGGKSFRRVSPEPVLGPAPEARLFRVVHSLAPIPGGWRVYYGAGSEFRAGTAKTLPVYDIRYVDSPDGLSFPSTGTVCITPAGEEHRVGRPYVIAAPGGYLMFYGAGSERHPYRLRCAESADGRRWTDRTETLGLEPADTGWDSEMMAYPAYVTTERISYLLYNGNAYGRDGFGCAVRCDL